MEENNKEVIEEVSISSEREGETPKVKTLETPEVKTTETPEAEITDTPAAVEKKETRRRKKTTGVEARAEAPAGDTPKKEASEEVKEEASLPQLKPSLRYGFQLKGHYYSRAQLMSKSVLARLWKKYPGLFEK